LAVESPPMIRDVKRWLDFENSWIASHQSDYAENLRLVEGMYDLARDLGRFTADDALDGLEKNIHLAAVLHRVQRTP
jgi:hypothetical protein